jgi:GH15 family glucan-1,4-alpha-glucosidase
MRFFRFAALALAASICLPAAASHLVTGNGFGFSVVAPETGTATKFYAHPYSFVRPDPANPLSEGIETANFIKELGWSAGPATAPSADYEDDSHIIHVRRSDNDGFFFMPFGLPHPALVISWQQAKQVEGEWHVEWMHPIRSRRDLPLSGSITVLLKFEDIQEILLLIPCGDWRGNATSAQHPLRQSNAWALVSIENEGDAEAVVREFQHWRAGLAPQALVRREIDELETWRVKAPLQFRNEAERHLWRQSEVMLRIAQSREPNRPGRYSNGLIVASLPDGVWFTPWVRDMAWATVALARMGHRDEARAALLAYFNARPTGKMRAETNHADYQVSVVRYFGDGAEEPFFTQEGSTNIEFDDWGEALWVLGEYLRRYDEAALLSTSTYRGRLYESARDYIAKPLYANLEKFGDGLIVAADTSIWEERQKDKKHFAFSTAMAMVGLRNFAEAARRAGDEAARKDALDHVALLEKGFNAAFIRGGKLHGTLEEGVKNDIDGALLPIINFGVVKDPAVVRDVVDRMQLLTVDSGGYRRVRSTYTDPAIFEYWYERQEFLFVDLELAELYRRLGRRDDANTMLERIVEKAAADHDIIPEMYVALPCKLFPGKIGDPTGALPMVGYGAGAYILHVLERADADNRH